ncbi:D-alanine--D-alanine ligase [Parasalinivibrio latis]|uniref:D-alanine--D-alanine ligase n=1 Tax=Parasalinivibrio latis TaxID=2952610 RepID=UPI0030E20837
MTSKNVLLLCGGGSSEHEVSLVSAGYLMSELSKIEGVNPIQVEITNEGWKLNDGTVAELNLQKKLVSESGSTSIDYVVPCIHGYPGETGEIQAFLDLIGLPYLGCNTEANIICFNKITSKLWFDTLGIPNTPYIFLSDASEQSLEKAEEAFAKWGKVFVKAASQGSSVGCYKVTEAEGLRQAIQNAFGYSSQVLIEKAVKPRELEVAAFEFNGEVVVTAPGEIYCPDDKFYTYDEKYSANSDSTTTLEPENLGIEHVVEIMEYAHKAFEHLRLKDLSRIDFFLTEDNEIYLNEINTFPGMTPISMFPKLVEFSGTPFSDFLKDRIFQ